MSDDTESEGLFRVGRDELETVLSRLNEAGANIARSPERETPVEHDIDFRHDLTETEDYTTSDITAYIDLTDIYNQIEEIHLDSGSVYDDETGFDLQKFRLSGRMIGAWTIDVGSSGNELLVYRLPQSVWKRVSAPPTVFLTRDGILATADVDSADDAREAIRITIERTLLSLDEDDINEGSTFSGMVDVDLTQKIPDFDITLLGDTLESDASTESSPGAVSDEEVTGQIQAGDFVFLDITVRHARSKTIIGTTSADGPFGALGAQLGVLVGSGKSYEELELDLIGRTVGDSGSVTIEGTTDEDADVVVLDSVGERPAPDVDRLTVNGIPYIAGEQRTVRVTGEVEFEELPPDSYDRIIEYTILQAYRWEDAEKAPGATNDSSESYDYDWPTHRAASTRTGFAPAVDAPVTDVEPQWNVEFDGTHGFLSPVVDDERVYTGATRGSPATLFAIDRETGQKAWEIEFGPFGVRGSPTVDDGVLYVGEDSTLRAIDAQDGNELWHSTYERRLQESPAVTDREVFVASGYGPDHEGHVYSYSVADGSEHWHVTLDDATETAPAVSGESVFVGSEDGQLYALSRDSGSVLWTYEADNEIDTTVGVHNGCVYFNSRDDELNNRIFAVDAESGEEVWRSDEQAFAPILDEKQVYAKGAYGGLYALDLNTGDVVWELDSVPGDHPCAVTDDTVYIGSIKGGSDTISAISTDDGTVRWSYTLAEETSTPLSIGDDAIYVVGDMGLVALTGR